jgi:hypothetical protein
MPGMYPDDQVVEIFGEQVKYPGLDPVTRKFTDGDFHDPLIKPSYIPAATFNLILDNMENLISAMGLNPNNTDPEQLKKAMLQGFAPRSIGEYHDLSYEPSVAELVRLRYLPCDYRIIKIALYQELCNLKWVGTANNAAADWWYKCDENGTRNVNGLFMRVEDCRGLFHRGAGANAIKKGANNTPYDGKSVGSFIGDAIRNVTSPTIGTILYVESVASLAGPWQASRQPNSAIMIEPNSGFDHVVGFFNISAAGVPTAHENRPGSISYLPCISY